MGSVFRYLLSGWVLHHAVGWKFPPGTFVVNIVGCLVIGILSRLVVKHNDFFQRILVCFFSLVVSGIPCFLHSDWKFFICCAGMKCW